MSEQLDPSGAPVEIELDKGGAKRYSLSISKEAPPFGRSALRPYLRSHFYVQIWAFSIV